jgi:acyl carrier protein
MEPGEAIVLLELTRLLRQVAENQHIDITTDTLLDDIPGLDSLLLLQVVARLEEHFHVEVDVVALDGLRFVGDVVNAISGAHPEQPSTA